MRLIDVKAFLEFHAGKARPDAQLLVEFNGPELAETAYAILSHCWGKPKEEVHFTEMEKLTTIGATARSEIKGRSGYRKIYNSCRQALPDGLHWLWVDTCCIDKRSSAELSEAINSMYAWYANSDCCYAYLHDTDAKTLPTKPDNDKFAEFNGWPKWFSRGWTLQELIAPENLYFFNQRWEYISGKRDSARALSVITRISEDIFLHGLSWANPSVAQIMSWAADRRSTREEDRAYSLLGLFGVHMPMLYGEGKSAFLRLQLEIIRKVNDQSIFAWGLTKELESASSFLADDPSLFRDCSNIKRMTFSSFIAALRKSLKRQELDKLALAEGRFQTFTVTNHGIQIRLPMQLLHHGPYDGVFEFSSVMLACCKEGEDSDPITITVERTGSRYFRYFRHRSAANRDEKAPIEFEEVFLPYQDNSSLSIRGPLSRQGRRSRIVSVEDIAPSDIVIVVLGPVGSGKSTIINKLTGMPPERNANTLKACTQTISAFAHVLGKKRFVFVDTPEFNPTTLRDVSMWLALIYRRSVKLTGVIYTWCISDNEMSKWDIHAFQILSDICGRDAIDRVRLVTTMWDEVTAEAGTTRENELKKVAMKPLLDGGARYERLNGTPESAWAVVKGLGNKKKVLLLQEEMVGKGIDLWKTSALKAWMAHPPKK
ncbi:heterokaryon incompatibility protein-domain-containing protein [Pisolithus tinctorius]|nr:heterokaryon incompatibility protein-domain-containing protein [Pisolithus tinctorius]